MKQLLLFIFSILLIVSCKKDQFATVKTQIAGTWEYHQFIGYPFNSTPLPRGNGRIIVMGTDGSFERRTHDTTLFRGSYALTERKDCYGNDKPLFFKPSDPSFAEYIVNVSGDTLILNSSNCLADGGTLIYLRN
jgi:hypothetical protein